MLYFFALVLIGNIDAAVVVFDQAGMNSAQPIEATIVDSNGNTFQQTVYYDPSIGGVDMNANWAGPNASIYFPTLGTGYVWYNGYWVNPEGYYWNNGARYYVGPTWNGYWANYWSGRPYWNGNWHGGHWRGGWHDGWHGNWHGGEGWHGGWHGGEGHGNWGGGREAGFRGGEGGFRGGRGGADHHGGDHRR